MKIYLTFTKSIIIMMFMGVLFISTHAFAQWGPGPYHIHQFHQAHVNVWRAGAWYHGNYRGRYGWYWVVGGSYYFYPAPIYPYPDPYVPGVVIGAAPVVVSPPSPQPPVLQSQPLPSVWYFCEPANAYYPYIAECPSGWKTIPATPPKQ
jgi:hypothetical protein